MAETVQNFGNSHPYTCLVIKNNGDVDPDDAFSRIPYEKGFSLLFYLQSLFGVEKFEKFLKGKWFKKKSEGLVPSIRPHWRL